MQTNTRDLGFVNFNGEEMNFINYNGVVVYEAWRKLIASGIPPLTLLKCKGEDVIDYRIYGNSVQTILPSEYQQVEYIESTGTQYIDTNFKPNQDTSLYVDFRYTTNIRTRIAGERETNMLFLVGASANEKWFAMYGKNSYTGSSGVDNTRKNIFLDKNNFYVDNILQHTFDAQMFQSTINIQLFGSAGISSSYSSLEIYSSKIYDNGQLVRYFIPCYRKSDNVIGMYDIVENKFYTNAGTGTFLKGGNAPTPDTPIEVESVGEKSKNLFDINASTKNTAILADGNISENSNFSASDFIKVKPNTSYTISVKTSEHNKGIWNLRIHTYDKDKNWISNITTKTIETFGKEYLTFTTSSNSSFIRISYFEDAFDIQLEEGNTVTEYEHYGYRIPVKVNDTITNIYLKEPLKKIGDYADYIDFEKRKVVRKINKIAFDGATPLFVLSTDVSYNYYNIGESGLVIDDTCLSTHFELQTNFSYQREGNNKFRIFNSPSNNKSRIAFRIYKDGAIISDIAEVKNILEEQYKKGTPVTFYYAHAEGLETEETITLPNILLNKGTNIIEIDTTITPSNMEVTYLGKK